MSKEQDNKAQDNKAHDNKAQDNKAQDQCILCNALPVFLDYQTIEKLLHMINLLKVSVFCQVG